MTAESSGTGPPQPPKAPPNRPDTSDYLTRDRPEVEFRRQRIVLHIELWLLWAACVVAMFWHLHHEQYDHTPADVLGVLVSGLGIDLTRHPASPPASVTAATVRENGRPRRHTAHARSCSCLDLGDRCCNPRCCPPEPTHDDTEVSQ